MVQAAFGDHSYDLLKKYDGDMMNFTREGHMEALVISLLQSDAVTDPKTPTIKNLKEVWKRLLRLPKHDLYTTFIMDDYTWEHVRQPWNHFNVPRYTRQLRDRDLYIDKYYQSENVERLDDALICAIGIIDTLKLQKNVAYWIKEGGLLLNHKPSMDTAMLHRKYWWGIPEIRKYWKEVGLEVIKEMRLPISPGVRQDVSFDPYRWKG
ncbi:hypothetical protein H0H93_008532 [Arthromyces matolae]|nr:hypothetical protein H0H93_008532 [Arthromyces matolae]